MEPQFNAGDGESLRELYAKSFGAAKQVEEDAYDAEEEAEKIIEAGNQELIERRRIPLGKLIITGKPYLMRFKELEEKTYNVFAFVSPMGGGKSTFVRNLIYWITKMEPECKNIIFDPMHLEFSKLTVMRDTQEKRQHLMNETMLDDLTRRNIHFKVHPDKMKVFHIVPRFALGRMNWDPEIKGYRPGWDTTTIRILQKDGGFVFAEDAAMLSEQQLFNALNYREVRQDSVVHYYLRAAYRICNNKYGERKWFIQEMIEVLRENVKRFRDVDSSEPMDPDDADLNEGTGRLSNAELQLIEKLEKYREAGFFVRNEAERREHCVDWRDFIRRHQVLNISFLAYKRTESIGEDFVRGQADLILERILEMSYEYMSATKNAEAGLSLTDWEQYLLKHWKVNLFFEETEIFMPRDCPKQSIKKWPTIRRIEEMMSTGRKYGIKNFAFVTQRITKVHPIIFGESSHLFLGSMIGDERDQILSDFGVDKNKVTMRNSKGQPYEALIRDVVTTLDKDKHQWVFIEKATGSGGVMEAYDAPVG